MTDPLRAALEAVVAKAVLDDSGFDGECLDYLVPIPTLDALRAALAADTAGPDPRDETIERLTRALRVANHAPHDRAGEPNPESGFPTCSGCGAILTAADARPGLIDVRQRVSDLQARWMLSEGDEADARCGAYDDVLDIIDHALTEKRP